jgi:hypothetical protein
VNTKILSLPWYRDTFRDDPAVDGFSEREKTGYAFVMSAITKLAAIWTSCPGFGLNVLQVKNAWQDVRPRTPPLTIFSTFQRPHALVAAGAIGKMQNPPGWVAGDFGSISGETWLRAQQQVMTGRPMGGHELPAATIGGVPAMLFEYRPPTVGEDSVLDPQDRTPPSGGASCTSR